MLSSSSHASGHRPAATQMTLRRRRRPRNSVAARTARTRARPRTRTSVRMTENATVRRRRRGKPFLLELLLRPTTTTTTTKPDTRCRSTSASTSTSRCSVFAIAERGTGAEAGGEAGAGGARAAPRLPPPPKGIHDVEALAVSVVAFALVVADVPQRVPPGGPLQSYPALPAPPHLFQRTPPRLRRRRCRRGRVTHLFPTMIGRTGGGGGGGARGGRARARGALRCLRSALSSATSTRRACPAASRRPVASCRRRSPRRDIFFAPCQRRRLGYRRRRRTREPRLVPPRCARGLRRGRGQHRLLPVVSYRRRRCLAGSYLPATVHGDETVLGGRSGGSGNRGSHARELAVVPANPLALLVSILPPRSGDSPVPTAPSETLPAS